MRSLTFPTAVLAAALASGCGDDTGPSARSGSSTGTGESANTTAPADGSSSGDESPGRESTESGGTGVGSDDGLGGECSLWTQDCPEGDKCTVWSDAPDLIPDDIRCCPEEPSGGIHGDQCAVEGYFGSCLDDCAVGHMCLDIDGDGKGTCQAFCGGDPMNPVCEPDETCFIYFSGVPFCFPQCDPLVQDCTPGEGCYPDDSDAGGTGFICMPTVGAGKIGDACWLLSNCNPGLLCVSADFLPQETCSSFPGAGCCSALCDINEPETCEDVVGPGVECVPWYYAGQQPPSANLADVGACVIPP